jgi:hypothetical protein
MKSTGSRIMGWIYKKHGSYSFVPPVFFIYRISLIFNVAAGLPIGVTEDNHYI